MNKVIVAILEWLQKMKSTFTEKMHRPAIYAVDVTIHWLRKKIKDKLSDADVEKVAVAEISKLSETFQRKWIETLQILPENELTHILATVGYDGNVIDVVLIKDTSEEPDQDVEKLINRTDEGMVVISA